MRFTLALVLPSAISVIAQPILADNGDAVATGTGLAAPEIPRSVEVAEAFEHHDGEKIHWIGLSNKDCSGRISEKDDIIHIKRKHGPGHPNKKDRSYIDLCLYGLARTAKHRPHIQPYVKKTLDYYADYWPKPSSSMQNDKRDEHARSVAAVEHHKGEKIHWPGAGVKKCSGRIGEKDDIVHIKREHGPGHPDEDDKKHIADCIYGLIVTAGSREYLQQYVEKTIYYYDWYWPKPSSSMWKVKNNGLDKNAEWLVHTMDYYNYEWH